MVLTGTSGNDTLTGGVDDDTITGADGNDVLAGGAGNDSINGGAGNDSVMGDAGDDTLQGGSDEDTVRGGAGDDRLYGGKGADTLDGGSNGLLGDTADYSGVFNDLNISLVTGVAVDGLGSTDTLLNIENLVGASHNDFLEGDDNDNTIEPGAGNDVVHGGDGFDTVSYDGMVDAVIVDLGSETATGTSIGNDSLGSIEAIIGTAFNDVLVLADVAGSARGQAGADSLVGGAGNDTLDGGAGNDTLDGGAGVDVVSYANLGNAGDAIVTGVGVTVNLVTGSATDQWGDTDTISGIEIIEGSALSDVLTGGNTNNGTGATDGFEGYLGGAGSDTINGGAGYDVIMYTTSTAAIKVTFSATGPGLVQDGLGGTDFVTGIEGVLGSAFNDTLRGSDTGVFESFEGGAGNDSITGFGGIDRVTYETAKASVTVNLALGSASDGLGGTDILQNIENVLGSAYGDTIIGSTAANDLVGGEGDDSITGGDGNDTLTGGAGNDTLDGGAGNDVARFTGLFDSYIVEANSSGDVIVTGPDGTDTLRNIEELDFSDATFAIIQGTSAADTLTGSATDDALFGGGGSDSLDGGGGDDLIDGGEGADTMAGGSGSDTYIVDDVGDVVIEGADPVGAQKDGDKVFDIGGSIDKVVASINFTLGGFVENLQLAGGATPLAGVGNTLDNVITGNAGNNVLTGMAGNDHIDGGDGIDIATYSGQRSQYTLTSGPASFQLNGTAALEGNDTLVHVERLQFANSKLALDLDGNAGMVAKILGAVFGASSVSNTAFVGIGLHYADEGMSYQALVQLAIDARLGPGASHAAVVNLLYTNVAGAAPDAGTAAYYTGLLDAGTYTNASLGVLASDISYNASNIGLTGLAQTGLAFV